MKLFPLGGYKDGDCVGGYKGEESGFTSEKDEGFIGDSQGYSGDKGGYRGDDGGV